MTKIPNDKPVWNIGYCHLGFPCHLVLVFWYLALFQAGGKALKSETYTNTTNGHYDVPRLEISSSGRQ
jgi:hypothetical protein